MVYDGIKRLNKDIIDYRLEWENEVKSTIQKSINTLTIEQESLFKENKLEEFLNSNKIQQIVKEIFDSSIPLKKTRENFNSHFNLQFCLTESELSSELFDIIIKGCFETLIIAIQKGILPAHDLKETLQHKITQEKSDRIIDCLKIFEKKKLKSRISNEAKKYLIASENALRIGKYEEALDNINRAEESEPESVEVWIRKGNFFDEVGRYEDAIICYNHAIRLDPKNAEAWWDKGMTLGKFGSRKETSSCFMKAIDLYMGID